MRFHTLTSSLRSAFGCRAAIAALLWLYAAAAFAADAGESRFQAIEDVVEREIQLGNIPGAVILIGHDDEVAYRRAFGSRALQPQKIAMTEDTIFDLASLTKVIATTTAVMQLFEQGKLRLDDPVERYWPEFGAHGKKNIRVRDLLTHSSGLRAGFDLRSRWFGRRQALERIAAEKPIYPSGKNIVYSDLGFIALGELVERVSGLALDVYCARNIFGRLGMKDTGFRPPASELNRIAPTDYRSGKLIVGEVHDPTAYRMGGVSGHAGLFSTADDLAIFARMLLDGGRVGGAQILKATTIEAMTARAQSANGESRGLGWEIAPHFAFNHNELQRAHAFGHTGYTGTSIWLDPDSKSYTIILTNRVHPRGAGDAKPLRANVGELVSGAVEQWSMSESTDGARTVNGKHVAAAETVSTERLQTGIDALTAAHFAPLEGLRVGLITNHTGVDSQGQRTIDLLSKASGVKLAALFSPEHGLYADQDKKIAAIVEPVTKLSVYSLYGNTLRPTEEMLRGLDALVFDIQDAGARFYTYISTMGYAMEAAAKQGLRFYVLDRPNPINAATVQGPVLDDSLKSFTGYFPLPVRHGMTVGELAAMFNREAAIGAKLEIVKMVNYRRDLWYDETGLRWLRPSPNLPTVAAAVLYPGVALVEGANISVGRGTDSPFEIVGAPWADARELAAYLNRRKILGVSFAAASFTPRADRYQNRLCHGVRIMVDDRNALDTPALGIEIASALFRLYPAEFQLDKTVGLIGARWVVQAIRDGRDARQIAQEWQGPLAAFRKVRADFLLYP